jgi:hypothetical protein
VEELNLPNRYDVTKNPPGSAFVIEQYDTTALNLSETAAQAYVNGSWPAWDRANKLTAAEGYNVTTHTCYVYTRCHSTFGHDARCPIATQSDIALVYCPNRSKTGSNWAKVAASDPGNFPVEVWWFHEVLYLATSNINSAYQPTGNWAHYGAWDTPTHSTNNFHYRYDLGRAQLLPLISWLDVQDHQYKAVGHSGGDTLTNVPACHGTSGSGVFRAKVPSNLADPDPEFLGPMVHGGTWADTQLCDNLFVAAPGNRMSYTAWTSSKALEALPDVQADRP